MQSKQKRFITRVILSYFGALIPVLAVSLFVFNLFVDRLQATTYASIQTRAERTVAELKLIQGDYATSSMTLSQENLLLGDFWTNNGKRLSAIRTLQNVTGYDPSISTLFLYNEEYGIFSSAGFSGTELYLSTTLGLDEDSVARIRQVLSGNEKRVLALHRKGSDTSGYLLLHYPFRNLQGRPDFSINYLLGFDRLAKRLRGIASDQQVYVRLTFGDGSTICFTERDGAMSPSGLIPACDAVIRHSLAQMNATMEVFYDTAEVYAGVQSQQQMNLGLLALGLLMSTLLSALFSTRRVRNLQVLESAARGEAVVFKPQNEYAYIGNILRDKTLERQELTRRLEAHSQTIRQQAVQLILSGGVKERTTAEELLHSCGLDWVEEFFFIGCATFDEGVNLSEVGDMLCRVKVGGKDGVAFFAETPTEKADVRRAAGERLLERLQKAGAQNIAIGLSRAYKEVALVSMAFREAEESIKSGGITCFDNVTKKQLLPPDQENLSRFADALRDHDIKHVQSAFDAMDTQIRASDCDEANKRLLRTYILQTFLFALDEGENEKLLQEVLQVNVEDADAYSAHIRRLVRKYAQQSDQEATFNRCLTYIHQHYADPSLSAEAVAEHAGINKANIGRMFKSALGKTYIDYVSEVRIEKAKELLAKTDLSLSAIAAQVGYCDRSSLYRKFKAVVGVDATEYRRINQEG